MADASSFELALWGLSQAGKTAFLAQLFHQPMNEKWQVWPRATSRKFFTDTQADTFANKFSPPTPLNEPAQVVCTLQRRSDGLTVALQVEDRSGKHWEWEAALDQSGADTGNPVSDGTAVGNEEETGSRDPSEVLRKAAGLIVMLHPTPNPKALERQVTRTLFELFIARDHQRDPRPVAICLSKADSLVRTPQELREAIEEPERFVLRRFPADLETWVRKYCTDPKFFPVSAVGVKLRYGVVEPMIMRDVTLTMRKGVGGKPINLMAPFDWIITRLQAQS